MRTALLLVSHQHIAEALVAVASAIFDHQLPMPIATIAVANEAEPEEVSERIVAALATLEQGHGVLILTDLFGATPANVASTVAKSQTTQQLQVVHGVNLPMLIQILAHADTPLAELALLAQDAGRTGIC